MYFTISLPRSFGVLVSWGEGGKEHSLPRILERGRHARGRGSPLTPLGRPSDGSLKDVGRVEQWPSHQS